MVKKLDAHYLGFFVLAELVDLSDVRVGELLNVVEAAAFFVLGDRFVL